MVLSQKLLQPQNSMQLLKKKEINAYFAINNLDTEYVLCNLLRERISLSVSIVMEA